MPRTAKEVLLMLADGAKSLIEHMENDKRNGAATETSTYEPGFKGIGREMAFGGGRPVCAVGHIIERGGLLPDVLRAFPSGNVTDNWVVLKSLGLYVDDDIRHALNLLTHANDSESRQYERVLRRVQEFEDVLRNRANRAREEP